MLTQRKAETEAIGNGPSLTPPEGAGRVRRILAPAHGVQDYKGVSMLPIVMALGLTALAGLALAAGACRLTLAVLPRKDP